MPPKRSYRKYNKKRPYKRFKRYKKGVKTNINSQMVTYMARQMPLPPKYRTKVNMDVYGYFPSGNSYHNTVQLPIKINSLLNPVSLNWPGQFGQSAPVGFTTLCNVNTYQYYRVYACKMQLEFIPQALTDNIVAAICPATINTAPTTVEATMAQPYAVHGMFNSNNNAAGPKNQLSIYMPVHKLIGCTSRAIQDDLSGSYANTYNSDPGDILFFITNWATPDHAVTSTNLSYNIKLTWWCEFWNLSHSTLA
ncbi:capsid protein [Circoviridae sp.]|nr:capsid protein [Circoviridae sp.]UOF82563.1 capsid protein [Circoviridae sp.]